MKVDFVRFKAADEVELQGWLNNENSDLAVIHIHGMSGNGYENYFLDNLRDMYAAHDISLFSIDTRGRGIVSDFRQGNGHKCAGSCFEIFDESIHDISGAIEYLRSVGKTRFILQGHSLGCTKVVNYLVVRTAIDIEKVILLAPTDMTGWAKTDPRHDEYLTKANKLLSENKGAELIDAQCWLDKTPISAQTYPTICEEGSSADIYGNREDGALLKRIEIPMQIIYGDADIGILQIDGAIDSWVERVDKVKNPHTQITIIKGSTHGYRGFEDELTKIVERFIEKR